MDEGFYREVVRRLLVEYGAALSPPEAVYKRRSEAEQKDTAAFVRTLVSKEPALCLTLLRNMLCPPQKAGATSTNNRLSAMAITELLSPDRQKAILTADVLKKLENTGWDKTIAKIKKGWEEPFLPAATSKQRPINAAKLQ